MATLSHTSQIIRAAYSLSLFDARWALVVTWHNVTFFGARASPPLVSHSDIHHRRLRRRHHHHHRHHHSFISSKQQKHKKPSISIRQWHSRILRYRKAVTSTYDLVREKAIIRKAIE